MAVTRNNIKRRLRSAFHAVLKNKKTSYTVFVKSGAETADFSEIKALAETVNKK